MTTKSDAIMAEAVEVMPGGVSSPVRAFKSVGGNPVVFDHVKGSKAYDVDGNEYVDYVGTWGPAIVGHADDGVLAAITETMQKGTSFGAPCALENELAKMVTLPALQPQPCLTLALGPKPNPGRVTPAPTLGRSSTRCRPSRWCASPTRARRRAASAHSHPTPTPLPLPLTQT